MNESCINFCKMYARASIHNLRRCCSEQSRLTFFQSALCATAGIETQLHPISDGTPSCLVMSELLTLGRCSRRFGLRSFPG